AGAGGRRPRGAARSGCARARGAVAADAGGVRRARAGAGRVKLALATQALDPTDPVLAATVPMARALAARVDELVVLADRVDRPALPENAPAHVFGAGTKAARGTHFASALARERPDAVLAHMSPIYALLAAPFRAP